MIAPALLIPLSSFTFYSSVALAMRFSPVFRQAALGRFDAVVALYHDQGLIPVKLLHFDDAVNFTLGLPFVRTSPDHGTAYDIAGRGQARADSFLAALDLAARLTAHRARSA